MKAGCIWPRFGTSTADDPLGWAVFHRPVPPRRLGRTLLFVHSEAADKVAEVAFCA